MTKPNKEILKLFSYLENLRSRFPSFTGFICEYRNSFGSSCEPSVGVPIVENLTAKDKKNFPYKTLGEFVWLVSYTTKEGIELTSGGKSGILRASYLDENWKVSLTNYEYEVQGENEVKFPGISIIQTKEKIGIQLYRKEEGVIFNKYLTVKDLLWDKPEDHKKVKEIIHEAIAETEWLPHDINSMKRLYENLNIKNGTFRRSINGISGSRYKELLRKTRFITGSET